MLEMALEYRADTAFESCVVAATSNMSSITRCDAFVLRSCLNVPAWTTSCPPACRREPLRLNCCNVSARKPHCKAGPLKSIARFNLFCFIFMHFVPRF